ncbi:hypothetical protein FACS1894217_02510 [Clostridia bacterium]|nr:hypothetical protein FACS1894217_02510 [Clostridia bacterium]
MEHIDLINKIIEAEERARQVAEAAKQKRENLEEDLKANTGGLRDSYFERAEARLKKVREREAALAEERITELDKTFERDEASIKAAYAKNKDVWVEKLFKMIVAGETA